MEHNFFNEIPTMSVEQHILTSLDVALKSVASQMDRHSGPEEDYKHFKGFENPHKHIIVCAPTERTYHLEKFLRHNYHPKESPIVIEVSPDRPDTLDMLVGSPKLRGHRGVNIHFTKLWLLKFYEGSVQLRANQLGEAVRFLMRSSQPVEPFIIRKEGE